MVDEKGHHTLDDIYDALHHVLDERGIDGKTHMEHHAFVEYLIDREKKKEERWEKFKMSFIGTIATATAGGMIWVGKLIWDHLIRTGGHH